MSSSNDFFNSSMAPPGGGKAAELKSRRRGPPPPRPSTAASSARSRRTAAQAPAASSSSSAFYSSGAASSTANPSLSAPPAARPAAAAAAPAPSYYGNHNSTTAATASSSRGYNMPSSSSSSSTSYYGAPVPAPAPPARPANMNNTNSAASTADWYSPPAAQGNNGTATDGWYNSGPSSSALQQPPMQSTTTTTIPSYTNFNTTTTTTNNAAFAGTIMDGTSSSGNYTAAPAMSMSTAPTIMKPAMMQSMSDLAMDENTNIDDFDNEPPLLEELGIHLDHILVKTRAVVLPLARFSGNQHAQEILHDHDTNDLAGPLVFALALGGELLLTAGKFQFSYIYGFGLFGCLSLTLVLNLMSPIPIHVWTVTSILGYALLPVNVLAICKMVVVHMARLPKVGAALALCTVAWSTLASTRLLEQQCGMRHQRYLVAYPIALLYSAFVMITIF